MLAATFIGHDARRRRVYRIPVEIVTTRPYGRVDDWLAPTRRVVSVISHSIADAANLIRDEYATVPYTTIRAYGPKGGRTERYIGAESAVWAPSGAAQAPRSPSRYPGSGQTLSRPSRALLVDPGAIAMLRIRPSDLTRVISTIDTLLLLQMAAIQRRDVGGFADWEVRADLYRARNTIASILDAAGPIEADVRE
jgi:hypothetical protein